MASAIKTIVSKKKLRYVGEGYNLDLSYITDRLIAMGFPAEKLESLYRNSLEDVKRFLDEKHGADHYKIYNLCAERERLYDPAKFHGRVAEYPFDDHHPPRFEMIRQFCEDVTRWLAEDQSNVAVVHCKAGKGRTGVMICCYLLHSGFYATAAQVLEHYGKQRTANEKGVTIPSQRRYIRYYDVSLRNRMVYNSVKMYLTSVVIDAVPCLGSTDNYALQFEITTPTRTSSYTSTWFQVKGRERFTELPVSPPLLISDDVKIEFSYRPLIKPKLVPPKKEFHFWLNTFFFDKCEEETLIRKSSNESDLETFYNPPERHASGGVAKEEETEEFSNLMKTASISDDTLLREQQQQRLAVSFASNVIDQTSCNSSFMSERMRHSSVPQAAASGRNLARPAEQSDQVSLPRTIPASRKEHVSIDGDRLTLKLTKSQIDKACKQRDKVYSPDFNLTLFLIRPKEQENLIDYTLTTPPAAGFPRAPLSSQSSGESSGGGRHRPLAVSPSAACVGASRSEGERSSPESSSEDETVQDSLESRSSRSSSSGGSGYHHHTSSTNHHLCLASSISSPPPKTDCQKPQPPPRTSARHPWSSISNSSSKADNHHHHHHLSQRSDVGFVKPAKHGHPKCHEDGSSSPHQVQFNSINNIMLSNKTATHTTLIQ